MDHPAYRVQPGGLYLDGLVADDAGRPDDRGAVAADDAVEGQVEEETPDLLQLETHVDERLDDPVQLIR